jgi:hypothetical protein
MSQGDVFSSLDSCDGGGGQRSVSTALLAAGFAGAFIVACLVALVVGHYTLRAPRSLSPFSSDTAATAVSFHPIVEPFVVGAAGLSRKAVGGERLNPAPGEDYALFVWVKLRRIPAHGEIFSVVSKFDSQVPYKPGYALSLEGAPDGVRPRVYLSAASGGGRWYSFAAYPMTRKHWYLFSMALSEETYVATYVAQHGSDQGPVFLGGYKMRVPSMPLSAADISVGSLGTSRFRGHVGPFGVLSAKGLQKNLSGYLADMQADPTSPPRGLKSNSIRLWATPTKDAGPAGYQIVQELKNDPQSSAPMPKAVKKSGAPKAADKGKKAGAKSASKGVSRSAKSAAATKKVRASRS